MFPRDIKVAHVALLFKFVEKTDAYNFRTISLLLWFAKILEMIMHNRLFTYLTINDILHKKRFAFQKGYSIDHTVVQLSNQINQTFDSKLLYSRSFHQEIYKRRIFIYGVRGKNLDWFSSYFSA